MLEKVKENIIAICQMMPKERVVVAVSGGADSVALLYIMYSLRDKLSLEIIVAHFNHNARGTESDSDETFVKDMAQMLNLPFISEKMEPIKTNLSEAYAREKRYDFLRKVARQEGANFVLLGHNHDDQAETILLNLIRGSASDGLSGMPMMRENTFIRPLLNINRNEIINYLQSNKISFVEDSTNATDKYLRNKIRHRLIPLIESEYNPRFKETIVKTAQIIAQENSYLQAVTNETLSFFFDEANSSIDVGKIKQLHKALQQRILKGALERYAKTNQGIYFKHIQELLGLLQVTEGTKKINLPHGIIAIREYDTLRFMLEKADRGINPFSYEVTIPATIYIKENRMTLDFDVVDRKKISFTDKNAAFFDYDKITTPLLIRNWQAGDNIKPLGMNGHSRKLQDILTDKKIPCSLRTQIPVLVDATGTVLWMMRIVHDEQNRVTEETVNALRIKTR
ncbi:MAG: tRNA lysidine(34) synthetase TilS [Deltaproteobacteria bacterium]